MGETSGQTKVLALAVLRSAVRGIELGVGPVTYRRTTEDVVPAQTLDIAVQKRWRWRQTEMLGGPLVSHGFHADALASAGFELPKATPAGLRSPGDGDDRLREGLLASDAGEWMLARCLLLEVLQEQPACVPAHAMLGRLLAELEHRGLAMAHLTIAVRLGLGALGSAADGALDPTRETERLLLLALVERARLVREAGQVELAAVDLRCALEWDPSDFAGAAAELARLDGSRVVAEVT